MLGRLHAAQTRWVELGPALFLFLKKSFWRAVMIGVRCKSYFVLSDVPAYTRDKFDMWVELRPTRIFEVIFGAALIIRVPCTKGLSEVLGRKWLKLSGSVNKDL